jgi:hypothetical protein
MAYKHCNCAFCKESWDGYQCSCCTCENIRSREQERNQIITILKNRGWKTEEIQIFSLAKLREFIWRTPRTVKDMEISR